MTIKRIVWWTIAAIQIFTIFVICGFGYYFIHQGRDRDAKTRAVVLQNEQLAKQNAQLAQTLCKNQNEGKEAINKVAATTFKLVLISVDPNKVRPEDVAAAKKFLAVAKAGLTPPLEPTDCTVK